MVRNKFPLEYCVVHEVRKGEIMMLGHQHHHIYRRRRRRRRLYYPFHQYFCFDTLRIY